jgi:hypothetical protein
MSTVSNSERRRSIPFVTGGTIERVFADTPGSLCPARLAFRKADRRSTADNWYPLARGILAGAVVERELTRWASGSGLTLELTHAIEAEISSLGLSRRVPAEQLPALIRDVHDLTRQWQQRFPPAEDGLAWENLAPGFEPQTDLVVVRQRTEPVFGLRIRPDVVMQIENSLVAVEVSTAKSAEAVGSARIALNHFALLAAVQSTPRFHGEITQVGTRVELLAQGTGYTRFLGAEEAEEWRDRIVAAATACLDGDTHPRPGPWCNRCPYFGPCQFVRLDTEEDLGL